MYSKTSNPHYIPFQIPFVSAGACVSHSQGRTECQHSMLGPLWGGEGREGRGGEGRGGEGRGGEGGEGRGGEGRGGEGRGGRGGEERYCTTETYEYSMSMGYMNIVYTSTSYTSHSPPPTYPHHTPTPSTHHQGAAG